MSTSRFDLVVIGSGPAGQKAALNAAKLGKRCAIIDRETSIGGVCIHTGTIPSKAIREAVVHLTGLNERAMYGHAYAVKRNITMADLIYRSHHVIRSEVDVIRSQMERNGVTMFFGTASFVDPHTIRITRSGDSIEIVADHVVIAVGTEPARPKSVPFTPGRVIDSNEILEMRELPRSMIIVGAGVIGTEYACMLQTCGVKLTLVDSKKQILDFLDEEIIECLQYRLRERGMRLRLGEKVASIQVKDDAVELSLESGKTLRADVLMYSIGRQGATCELNLEVTGLQADERGRLSVNEYYQTTVQHIYAAGDVIGFPALAATSMEQGRLASSAIFRQLVEAPQPLFPYGIWTIPEISMVGATEAQLTQSKTPYEIGTARYREIARGQLISDPNGMLKILFHPSSRRLLGVHAIGTGACELIHIGQTIMSAGLPIDYFVEAVFNYPTLAECYKVAALDGINRVRSAVQTTIPIPESAIAA